MFSNYQRTLQQLGNREMDKDARRRQSEEALKNKSANEKHNQALAYGCYWHGLYRLFGLIRRPNLRSAGKLKEKYKATNGKQVKR